MNLKPTKINPINISPSGRQRQPLQDIINLTRQQPPKINLKNQMWRAPPHVASILKSYRPRILHRDPIEEEQEIVVRPSVREERHSLKPSNNSYLIMMPKEVEKCANHSQKYARFRVTSDEIELYYCYKCAILLASQGFKVERFYQARCETPQTGRSNFNHISEPHLPPISNFLVDYAQSFSRYLERFLTKCHRMNMQNLEYREKLNSNYEEILKQLDYLYHELQASINLLFSYHKAAFFKVYQQIDNYFGDRLQQLSKIYQEMSTISFDIQSNLNIVAALEQNYFEPIMNKYRYRLHQSTSVINSFSAIDQQRLRLMSQQTEYLQELMILIGRFRNKTGHVHQVNLKMSRPESKQASLSENNSMFFSFENGSSVMQPTIEPTHNELDHNVNVIHTNSDDDEYSVYMQESIVDPDFTKLLSNVH